MTRNVKNRRARVARRLTGVLLASVAIVASAQVATAQSARSTRSGGQTASVSAPLINRVVFQGNKKLKSEQLGPELQTQARTPYSQSTVDNDIERIREIYRRGGRSLAKVSARMVPLANDRKFISVVVIRLRSFDDENALLPTKLISLTPVLSPSSMVKTTSTLSFARGTMRALTLARLRPPRR